MRAAGVKILRWVKIRSPADPYDPEWELYLEQRLAWKLTHTLAGRGRIEYLWKEQQGRCVVCGQALCIEERPWHIHHRVWRSQGGQETCDNLEMLHANCHRQIHSKKESLKTKPRPARGVSEGLSRMRRKSQVRFLGGGEAAMSPCYPTDNWQ